MSITFNGKDMSGGDWGEELKRAVLQEYENILRSVSCPDHGPNQVEIEGTIETETELVKSIKVCCDKGQQALQEMLENDDEENEE